MKLLRKLTGNGIAWVGLLAALALLAGCQTSPYGEPTFSEAPVWMGPAPVGTQPTPPATGRPGETTTPPPVAPQAARFRNGDLVVVTFSGLSEQLPPHEERIKDDGTVSLPLIGAVTAAGKTLGELQKEIHDRYVPKYYVRLTVTVKHFGQFYYVGGEVKLPSRQEWVGEITVTQAIQSAGDFTDFANKKKVRLTRVDGRSEIINCVKALANPALDLKVLPGDKIHVPRRWW